MGQLISLIKRNDNVLWNTVLHARDVQQMASLMIKISSNLREKKSKKVNLG
jgi:hypothetical protein